MKNRMHTNNKKLGVIPRFSWESQTSYPRDFCFYLSGFVDGEGCFSISFRSLPRLSVRIESRPSFSIAQKKCRENHALLEKIRDLFGGGGIRDDGRGCYKYESRSLECISKRVIPFFSQYPLHSQKRKDFLIFKYICSRMETKQHLHPAGLRSILERCQHLNTSGTRRNTLRDLIAIMDKRQGKTGV